MIVAASPKPFFQIVLSYFKTRSLTSCFYALAILILFSSNSSAATIVVPPTGDLQAAIDAAQFGDTIILQAGASYQTPGAPYYSPFYLGPKSGGTGTDADFITIRTSNLAALPTGRVSPQDRPNLAKIVALGNGGAFNFLANARYWKLQGLEITNLSDGTQLHHVNTFITIGGVPGIAHNQVDRCYVHPQEDGTNSYARTASHGIVVASALSGANVYDTRITNNYISGFGGIYGFGAPQLIDGIALSTNVLDTILLDNNFLSATYQPWFPGGGSATNAMSGVVQASPAPTLTSATLSNVFGLGVGDYISFEQTPGTANYRYAAGRITNISGNNLTFTSLHRFIDEPQVPAVGSVALWKGDVGRNYTITHNTFDIDPVLALAAFNATGSTPKGFIEMKMGDNVLIEGNIFQGWPSSIAINAVNQDGSAPWVTVNNFTFRNNWVKNFGSTFTLQLGNSEENPGGHLNAEGVNLTVENNLFTQNNTLTGDHGASKIGIVGGGLGVVIRHNTWASNPTYDGGIMSINAPVNGLVLKDNIFYFSRYGFVCGPGAFQVCFPNWIEQKNVVINNLLPSNDSYIQSIFPNSYVASPGNSPVVWTGSNPHVLSDWALAPGSPYKAGGARQASDGTDVGVNFVRLSAALAGGSEPPPPTPTPTPIPSPTATPTVSPTPTPTVSPTPTPTVSPTPTPSPTPVVTPSPTPTPVPGDHVPVVGYLKIDGQYLGGAAVVSLSTVSGEFIKSTTSPGGGYFEFDYGSRGNILTATSAGYVFESKTIDGSAYYVVNGSASSPAPTPTPIPQPTPVLNPVDDPQTFVRQQYLDFLGREPDTGGWTYWTDAITNCAPGDVACVRAQRINVSAAFFIELEFQETGSFVYRFYKSALGRKPSFAEFSTDRTQVVTGNDLETNKLVYATAFARRTEFIQRYPLNLPGPQFVDALLQTVRQNSGVDLTSMRAALVADWFARGSRSRIVRMVADSPAFSGSEFNSAFVLMQYFGYLRRDADPGGYDFWLNILNSAPNNHRAMVCAFLTSAEYQRRFSSTVTRTDAECGQ